MKKLFCVQFNLMFSVGYDCFDSHKLLKSIKKTITLKHKINKIN